ncbi:metallophosphoesterase [Phycisphaera mikurensis]|uniref:Calcineurin-like phosphoesterase domain-containing protein n=1 Tax=Phycisphaera mikurensis (strain NBRC 102666 / KCTC 22515 / FYK2301M01) TaxID=1142394 RepID=I0IFK0_PHYMF|nr:metallophosphoesterase [Phycisphaera mikurensis]MBB6440570.1 putative phosphodiesterase [Phycisphaera mikurensis]BAM04038.1 hypothetical protein PSMK_18790 [Phycisphaera mikurensis NBRC 102666]
MADPPTDRDHQPEDAARTLVISDLHLGQPGRSPDPQSFATLFRGFDRVVLNGDTAEVQVPELRARASRHLVRLQAVAEAAGAELSLIAGNHDAFLTERRRLTLLGGRVLVTHGDVLHPAVAPWSGSAPALAADTRRRLAAWEAEHGKPPDADARLEIARHVSHGEFLKLRHGDVVSPLRRLLWWSIRPKRFLAVLGFWRTAPARAAAFARQAEPAARVVVVGHSHRAGSWRERGCLVLDTGAFTWPGKPHAVVIEGDRLTFHAVLRRAGGFELDEEVLASYAPEATPAAPAGA